jgi:hypothetical protein
MHGFGAAPPRDTRERAMAQTATPTPTKRPKRRKKEVQLIANGDLRLAANQLCWPAQEEMEKALERALSDCGYKLVRVHEHKPELQHGFISTQHEGMEVFRHHVDPEAPLIVAEALWQYSHHILHGLIAHEGPLLTVANWSGQWPGLVGLLNLNGSLTKAGVKYSTLWSEDFTDDDFLKRLRKWLEKGRCTHPTRHVTKSEHISLPAAARRTGEAIADELVWDNAIMGIFDEGCMGMFNAIFPDGVLNELGIFKERMTQSALYYETTQVADEEAREVRRWVEDRGLTFHTGDDPQQYLTDDQILGQCKMYIAAARMADDFGCDIIGIQYQLGLMDLLPASDLAEGMLNNSDRPPVRSRDGKRIIRDGEPIPHFNEVDQGAGLDALITNRVHKALGQPVETTLHDVRWGDWDRSGTVDEYVWVFLISGSVPPAHLINGWAGADAHRQPAAFFRSGGGTLRGVSKPGEIVWSRFYLDNGRLRLDIGRAGVVELPAEETQRRWEATTAQWPIMHAVTYGVSRDEMMGKHKSNHLQVAYANSAKEADQVLLTKVAVAEALGISVHVCGTRAQGKAWS